MLRYFKLGTQASTFYDSKSKLKICNKQVVSIESSKINKRVKDSIGNGHIVEVKESEFEEYMTSLGKDIPVETKPEITSEKELEEMDEDELKAYAKSNCKGIEKKDLKGISNYSKEELIEFIREW